MTVFFPAVLTVTSDDGQTREVLTPVPVAQIKAIKFRETDHPRDSRGRFIEVGGIVSIFGGGRGEVLRTVGGGRIEVRRTDNRVVTVDAQHVTVIRAPANKPPQVEAPSTPDTPAADAQAAPDAPDAPAVDQAADPANAPTDPDPAVGQAQREAIHNAGRGRPDGAGTVEDPIDVEGDIERAAQLLGEGKHIRLNGVAEVGTLIDRLNELVADARANGDKAPTYDLCRVSVPRTNLFCAQSKGIPRAKMPQLSGRPRPGSRADSLPKSDKGRVDLAPQFREELARLGIGITAKTVPAAQLKASQIELDGAKVASMVSRMESGAGIGETAIFVTRDGYVIDGHHRWAAKVGLDTRDGQLSGDVTMPVEELDMEIGEALDLANQFAQEFGIPQATLQDVQVGLDTPPPVATPDAPGSVTDPTPAVPTPQPPPPTPLTQDPPQLVGATPDPTGDPTDSTAYLTSPDGAVSGWLSIDGSQDPAVALGWIRTDANDRSTTFRYDDTAAWVAEADRRQLVTSDRPATDPAGPAAEPDAVATSGAPAGLSPNESAPDVAQVRSDRALAPSAPSREDMSRLLLDGLDANELGMEDNLARRRAKQEVVVDLTARMREVPDDLMLDQETRDLLSRIESGQSIYVRRPPAGPLTNYPKSQWEYTEFTADQWRARTTGAEARGTVQALDDMGVEIVTAEQWRERQRQTTVNNLVAGWASSSNDQNVQSLALQQSAEDLFGLESTFAWDIPDQLGASITQDLEARRDLYDSFLLAQYESTQEWLADNDITELNVYRGMKLGEQPEWLSTGEPRDVPMRPLSSFTTDPQVAAGFASTSDRQGLVLQGSVPADRVLSVPRTGFGSLPEQEVVILAGPGTWDLGLTANGTRPGFEEVDLWDNDVGMFGSGFDLDTESREVDDPGDDEDVATLPAGFLTSKQDLMLAIAAADTDARRAALMRRAQDLGFAELIPSTWREGGAIEAATADVPAIDPANVVPLTDEQYLAHTETLQRVLDEAIRAGLETNVQFTLDADRTIYTPERSKVHKEILDELWAQAGSVPNDGRALIAGGLGGAGKSTTLADPRSGVNQAEYLTVNPDDIKELLAARGLVPQVEGLSPLEASSLVHEESSYLAQRLAARAYAERKNMIWDITMASRGSVESRIRALREAGYGQIGAIFVDIPLELSVERALGRHRGGLEQHRRGIGYGGRYVPPAIIRKNADSEFSSANRKVYELLKQQFDFAKAFTTVGGNGPELLPDIPVEAS